MLPTIGTRYGMFDPRIIPISSRGSWMNVGYLVDREATRGEGLYLRSNHARPLVERPIARLVPLDPHTGTDLHPFLDLTAKAGTITMCRTDASRSASVSGGEPQGCLEIIFDGTDSLRIAGTVGVRIESAFSSTSRRDNAMHAVAYAETQRRFVFNARVWLRRYGIEVLRGSATLCAPWNGETTSQADITVLPDASGKLELAIDEFSSTWTDRPRDRVSTLTSTVESRFEAFVEPFTTTTHVNRRTTVEQAAGLLWMCTQKPTGILRHETIFMSLNWMDAVWSWDNWINMLPLASTHADLAYDQFLTVSAHQDEHGAYPDALNDGFLHFNFAKPPVQGVMIAMIETAAPQFWTPERKRGAYHSVGRFTEWWLHHRTDPRSSLCHYLHGNDSGWDNGSLLSQGVPLVAPDLNALLAYQCRTLGRWAHDLERPRTEIDRWHGRADRLKEALMRELWSNDHFVARCAGTIVDTGSLATALPGVLGDELPEAVRAALRRWFQRFRTTWGLASEAPDSPFYEAENYWRGPIWAPATLLAIHALERLDDLDTAEIISRRFLDLVEQSGFAENFHAETGAPLVDPGYTWTAAVYLALAARDLSLSE